MPRQGFDGSERVMVPLSGLVGWAIAILILVQGVNWAWMAWQTEQTMAVTVAVAGLAERVARLEGRLDASASTYVPAVRPSFPTLPSLPDMPPGNAAPSGQLAGSSPKTGRDRAP